MTREPFIISNLSGRTSCYFVCAADWAELGVIKRPYIITEESNIKTKGKPRAVPYKNLASTAFRKLIKSRWEAVHGRRWPSQVKAVAA